MMPISLLLLKVLQLLKRKRRMKLRNSSNLLKRKHKQNPRAMASLILFLSPTISSQASLLSFLKISVKVSFNLSRSN